MKVAVLGDGLLARSIKDVLPEAVILGHDAFEITSMDSLVAALKPIKPDVIVNTVALHHLARCEDDPMLAQLVNAIGAGRVASLAPTIYVSTDYVFNDGGPHDEVVPGQRPRSVYGQTKLAGELATLEQGGIVVRVSALFGHHRSHKGPTFPEVIDSSFAPLKLPTDQRFSPTYAPDAAGRIAYLATRLGEEHIGAEARGLDGIFHAANAGSCSWYEFGTQISEVTRHPRTITGAAAHDRLRPTNSSLRSVKLPPLPHWLDALSRWASERDRQLYANRVSPLRADPS